MYFVCLTSLVWHKITAVLTTAVRFVLVLCIIFNMQHHNNSSSVYIQLMMLVYYHMYVRYYIYISIYHTSVNKQTQREVNGLALSSVRVSPEEVYTAVQQY